MLYVVFGCLVLGGSFEGLRGSFGDLGRVFEGSWEGLLGVFGGLLGVLGCLLVYFEGRGRVLGALGHSWGASRALEGPREPLENPPVGLLWGRFWCHFCVNADLRAHPRGM